MATNVTVRSLADYPDISKTVTLDHSRIIALGSGGDEIWVVSATTTATASGSTSIQDAFIEDLIIGYSMSAGFNQGPFTISASQDTMKVSIDGSTARSIALGNSASSLTGTAVATDMQSKIRELALTGGLEAANLAFKNATVEFINGRFFVTSGNTGTAYTGSGRSSVRVTAGASNDVSEHLGFLAPIETEATAGTTVSETYVSFQYTVSSGTLLDVNDGTLATGGSDCIAVTDGTNTEYRFVSTAAAGQITMNSALSNTYNANSRVQVLRLQDPRALPATKLNDIDSATRYAIASLVNQIDFSS